MRIFKKQFVFLLAVIIAMSISVAVYADGDDEVILTGKPIEIIVRAKNAVVIDSKTGMVIFEQNSNEAVSVSHLVKLMTLLLTAEALDSGKFTLDTMLSVSANANSMGDPQIWLNVGEKISVYELINAITVGNANDASVVLAEAIGGSVDEFVEMMNAKAQQLGMTNTVFTNPTGMDSDGQLSSAYDIALLSAEILKHDTLIPYMTTWMLDVREGQTNLVNMNRMVRTYKGITGLKAGASNNAGSCLAVSAERNNLSIICVILNAQTADTRFEDAKTLLDKTFAEYEMFIPEIDHEQLMPIAVKGGQSLSVDIAMQTAPGLVIPRGTSSGIKTVITVTESVEAPIKAGQELGSIQFFSGEELVIETKLIAAFDVKKNSVGFSFKKLLGYLLNF